MVKYHPSHHPKIHIKIKYNIYLPFSTIQIAAFVVAVIR